jgi:hypothetical protein
VVPFRFLGALSSLGARRFYRRGRGSRNRRPSLKGQYSRSAHTLDAAYPPSCMAPQGVLTPMERGRVHARWSAPEILEPIRAQARCSARCAGCSCDRDRPAARVCRGQHWRAHNHTHAAACAGGCTSVLKPSTRPGRGFCVGRPDSDASGARSKKLICDSCQLQRPALTLGATRENMRFSIILAHL